MNDPVIGFVGLGNMGSALALNLVGAGHTVLTHDVAGPGASPEGAQFVETLGELAASCDVVVLSLPDGSVSAAVIGELLVHEVRRFACVIDTSTVGPQAARENAATLAAAGVEFVDAPVSGGRAGALARTLAVMYSAPDGACAVAAIVLEGLSDNRVRVGDRAGLAQAAKLANNFLSATALLATSEAVAFGVASGLDMGVLLDVLNASSGRNSATADKFPNHVLTGTYASGFTNTLMAKDMDLYLREVRAVDGADEVGAQVATAWQEFAAKDPNVDFTRIHLYVTGD